MKVKEFFKKYKTVIGNAMLVLLFATVARFFSLHYYFVWVVTYVAFEWLFIGLNFLVIRKLGVFVKDLINRAKLQDVMNISLNVYVRNFIINMLALSIPYILTLCDIWK